MAEEITCPACETSNDPWNELCETCGADLHANADAPVHADATDGDEFVEPGAGEEAQDFEGVEQVQAYDDANPDDGVDEDLAADGEQDFGAVPAEAPEDEQADEQGEVEYELEVIEPEAENGEDHARGDDEQWEGEESQPEDDQFDGGTPLDDWDDDEVAADGGAPLAAEAQLAGSVDPLVPDSGVELDEGTDADADGFAAEGDAPGGDEFDDEFDDQFGEGFDEEVAAESEVDEEPPPPPELAAILNPQQLDRTPIEPLPTPGPYAELATLTVLRAGEQLGEVAIDFNCTVLGLDNSEGAADEHAPAEPVSDEDDVEEAAYELEAIEPVEAQADLAAADDQGFNDVYELEAIEEESSPSLDMDDELGMDEGSDVDEQSEMDEQSDMDEESDWAMDAEEDAYADSEVDEEPLGEEASYEDPDDLEEGPVIDLSAFGDRSRFARRHGYLFRQNKHYTLYVLSDMGTQVNDELLEIGEHRELADGDVIVLGGEVALKFNKPAA